MQFPRWLKSIAATLSPSDRRAAIRGLTFGTVLAAAAGSSASGQEPTKAVRSDIKFPIDSGFANDNQKFIRTTADSFVINAKGEVLRFRRKVAALAVPDESVDSAVPRASGSGSGHGSHASHASHSSHRSGGWV